MREEALTWRPSDPGRFALRNALRAAIVIPVSLVLGRAIGDDQTALFAVFGSVSTLIFADFGGPRAARLVAYLVLAGVGFVLIPIGTVCSTEPVLAAAVMAVVGFVVLFSGVINGYLAAASGAALLSYILPVMVPAGASEIPDRLLGFTVACGLSIPGALLLFPKRPRDRLRAGVAKACGAVARLIEDAGVENEAEATSALSAVHRQFASTPFRPTGPTGATGALAILIDELDWLKGFRSYCARSMPPRARSDSERNLGALSVATLECCAEILRDGAIPAPEEEALERGRAAVLEEVLQMLSDPAIRDDDDRLWAAIFGAWEARMISYTVLDVARHAMVASNRNPAEHTGPAWLEFIRRQSLALGASGRVILAHADVRSVWFRNSLRGAVGLSLAVLLAQLISLQHSFWAVLGSLSVLRSSALSTGATILRAVIGTTVGIIVGGLVLVALGNNTTVLWIVLPFAALVAAYAPRAISFAAGQAGFTVLVFVAFDLIVPTGWNVGLIRLEDVSIGFGVSLLVGLLFWPHGAYAVLRRSIAAAMATAARYAEAAIIAVLAGGSDQEMLAGEADSAAAQNRLDTAFRQRLAERPSDDPRVAELSRLLTATARIRRTAAIEHRLAAIVRDAPRPAAAGRLGADARDLASWYVAFGEAFAARTRVPRPSALDPLEHPAMLEALRESATDGRAREIGALACAWSGLQIDELRRLQVRVAEAAQTLHAFTAEPAEPAEPPDPPEPPEPPEPAADPLEPAADPLDGSRAGAGAKPFRAA
jgi:uncharacterized membrane protein YccC